MQAIAEMPFIASHVALDFVNTGELRGHPAAGDVLITPHDLNLWGRRYGLITTTQPDDENGHIELERAREARELLYTVLLATINGEPPTRRACTRLAELATDAYSAASLQPHPNATVRWRWNPSQLSTVRHTAVTSAVDLLATDHGTRLKQCPGDHCGWLFLDSTKRGNRRWCLMSECGQAAKNQRRRKPGLQ